ncbi:excisionase family DNA binding protein [Murinocardiopsis flavida]|uniref:Excisionase family DNA binding protein n=1 Tax=Murinocardiopsis flavida TaxID=645275 RepID=A0A2P8CUU4_9ACTN|nr:helix-turn-helix domain-containing protein [Murinocardiopsis flavida]PSK88730.1 excisionase family DNA binding protein [Murinocardiopsis flavida]
MASNRTPVDGRLLTVAEVAERLNTSVRYPRRLIEERRIAFVKIGRHVRVPESSLNAFIASGVVEPVTLRMKGAA